MPIAHLKKAFLRFIITTTSDHLIICTKDLRYLTLSLISRQLYINEIIADFSRLKPILAKQLHQKAY